MTLHEWFAFTSPALRSGERKAEVFHVCTAYNAQKGGGPAHVCDCSSKIDFCEWNLHANLKQREFSESKHVYRLSHQQFVRSRR